MTTMSDLQWEAQFRAAREGEVRARDSYRRRCMIKREGDKQLVLYKSCGSFVLSADIATDCVAYIRPLRSLDYNRDGRRALRDFERFGVDEFVAHVAGLLKSYGVG